MIFKLPPVFYFDHVSRDLPAGRIVRETKTAVFVDLDEQEHAELLSDAEYYWGEWQVGSFDRDMFGTCTSARATVSALAKQGTTTSSTPVHKEDSMTAATLTRKPSTKQHRATAKDQGFPACYLGPTGNFKPGLDARAKSDLRAAVAGERTGAELHRFTKATAQKLLAARGW